MSGVGDTLAINWNLCRQYIFSRQTVDGGFCFYRAYGVEESNALDVYSAISALTLMHSEVPRRETLVAWLQKQQAENGSYSGQPRAWFVLESLRLLGAEPAFDPRAYLKAKCDQLFSLTRSRQTLAWSSVLKTTHRLIRLLRYWDVTALEMDDAVVDLLRKLQGVNGGYGWPNENLIDTAEAAGILAHLQLDCLPQGVAFARACVDKQTGFRLVPDSTAASLESLLAGVSIFKLGKQELPQEIALASLRFISSCQSSNGGFGRTSGAIPTLADTRLALEALQQLSGPSA